MNNKQMNVTNQETTHKKASKTDKRATYSKTSIGSYLPSVNPVPSNFNQNKNPKLGSTRPSTDDTPMIRPLRKKKKKVPNLIDMPFNMPSSSPSFSTSFSRDSILGEASKEHKREVDANKELNLNTLRSVEPFNYNRFQRYGYVDQPSIASGLCPVKTTTSSSSSINVTSPGANRFDGIGIMSDRLLLGCLEDLNNKKVMLAQNVKYVISIYCFDDNNLKDTLPMIIQKAKNYLNLKNHWILNENDQITASLRRYFDEYGKKIADILKNEEEEKEKTSIFIHCQAGISRSATILAAYFIKYDPTITMQIEKYFVKHYSQEALEQQSLTDSQIIREQFDHDANRILGRIIDYMKIHRPKVNPNMAFRLELHNYLIETYKKICYGYPCC